MGAPPRSMHSAKRAMVGRRGEDAGVSGDAAHHVSVFVVDLTLDNSAEKCGRLLSAGFGFHSAGGLKRVRDMPSGVNISRSVKQASGCPATLDSSSPRTMNPMSLYSARDPGGAINGAVSAAWINSSRRPAS